jgi:hypothetical protein
MWLKELTILLSPNDKVLLFMPGILNVILPCLSYGDENLKKNIKELARSINTILWVLISEEGEGKSELEGKNKLNIDQVITALSRFMVTPNDSLSVNTTTEALKWNLHLVNKQPNAMLAHVDDFFSILIAFLSDPSKEVHFCYDQI